MTRKLLTGNAAAAWGARLAEVDYVPAFPITPQTEIIETLSYWIDAGEMDAKLTMLESEHSMVTAAGAAAATGARVFTATSSQGLLYAMEMLYTVAGWRVPLVLVNVSRGLASPITLEPDHNDVLAARDSGCLQIHCATCQEVLDAVILGHRLAEDEQVRLPVIVNLDGFYLSFTREPVVVPEVEDVRAFLPRYEPQETRLRASDPQSQAVAVLGGSQYSYFRYQAHLAACQALPLFEVLAAAFRDRFGRSLQVVEAYEMQDAEYAFVMLGSFATKARQAVQRLRETGLRVGLLRPRLVRPFPVDHIRQALSGMQAVAVVDQNLSVGRGGILYGEIASALYGLKPAAPVLLSFIGGLGGRDISEAEFFEMAREMQVGARTGQAPPPRLLFTRGEQEQMRLMQTLAGARQAQDGHDDGGGGSNGASRMTATPVAEPHHG